MKLTEAQREWLSTALNEQGEIACFENSKPIIDDLHDVGLMTAVSGKFRCKPENPFVLYSIYRITPAGRLALQESDRPASRENSRG